MIGINCLGTGQQVINPYHDKFAWSDAQWGQIMQTYDRIAAFYVFYQKPSSIRTMNTLFCVGKFVQIENNKIAKIREFYVLQKLSDLFCELKQSLIES